MSAPAQRADDAIVSLSRVAQACSRWMEQIHLHGTLIDLDEELDHIKANVARVEKLLKTAAES